MSKACCIKDSGGSGGSSGPEVTPTEVTPTEVKPTEVKPMLGDACQGKGAP
jgi:hypothetical protein